MLYFRLVPPRAGISGHNLQQLILQHLLGGLERGEGRGEAHEALVWFTG